MDIISHGLWPAALSHWLNMKKGYALKPGQTAFWGMFPDLLAFTIPFLWLGWSLATDAIDLSDMRHSHSAEGTSADWGVIGKLTALLYQIGHSGVIFLAVFLLLWFVRSVIFKQGKPYLELGAWGIHILMDIPTHRLNFYPTPFLWPISDVQVDGISWGTPWFMGINVFLLIAVYGYIFYKRKRAV